MKHLPNTHSHLKCFSLSIILFLISVLEISGQNSLDNNIPLPFIELTFDETKGEIAHNSGSAGSRFDAVIGGGNISWEQGLINGAAQLDNNGFFQFKNAFSNLLTDFSLSVWVNIHQQGANQTICIFAQGTSQYFILTTQRGDREQGVSLVMTKSVSEGDQSRKEERISNEIQKEILPTHAWHHIAFTLKGNVGTLYLDGSRVMVKTDFTTNLSKLGNTSDNYIGKSTWPDPYLNGLIDDFRIYDCALTEDQILQIAASADKDLVKMDSKSLWLEDLSAITNDLYLPQHGKSGSIISWKSKNTKYLSHTGKIRRPDAGTGDVKVFLIAEIQKGKASEKKEFTVNIKDITQVPEDKDVFSMQTGNPTVPAYLADASFYYDENTKTFYAYGTNDGAGGENVYPTQVWFSSDCKNWRNKIIQFPKSWTDSAGTNCVWAPSITYNSLSKKYYLMYSIDAKVFIAMADHPLGPWQDANGKAPGNLFYHGYDGQFFIDDDNTMYVVTDAGKFKIIKFKTDKQGKLYFDNDDARFDKTGSNPIMGEYKYKQIEEIKNSFEAAYIYKRNNVYYLMWSFNGSENYNVRYAVSDKLTGPYREINYSMTIPILQRDDDNHILGPGHHSMFNYNERTFIAYHRQHYPFIDSKRQTCIEEVFFNPDGSIQTITPSHKGVVVTENIKPQTKNIAMGKPTLVSSVREYDNSDNSQRYRTHDISFRFSGNFAVDENYGTRWDVALGANKPWIIVDLGQNATIDSVELYFEFTSRNYKYKVEYLDDTASNINLASNRNDWKLYVDKSKTGSDLSPVTEVLENRRAVSARYIRLTIFDVVNLPYSADGADPINAINSISLYEFKVFGKDKGDVVGQKIEAEAYYNQYGIELIRCGKDGLAISKTDNNDYLTYENVDFGKGADKFIANIAPGSVNGQLLIYLDNLENKPVGILQVNIDNNQIWRNLSINLNKKIRGKYDKVYLLFKGDGDTNSLFKIDWFMFQ